MTVLSEAAIDSETIHVQLCAIGRDRAELDAAEAHLVRVRAPGLPCECRQWHRSDGASKRSSRSGTSLMGQVTSLDAATCSPLSQRLIADRRYAYVINGHTHRRMVRSFDSLITINAGTLLRDHEPCVAIVDFQNQLVDFFDIDPSAITPASRHRLCPRP